jgi:predicted small lipoprotein YifL
MKRTLLFLLISSAVASLTGCGDTGSGNTPAAAGTVPEWQKHNQADTSRPQIPGAGSGEK